LYRVNLIARTVKPRYFITAALLFLCFAIKGQTSYDINDPRNPNCPCHKYQKIADEEYARLMKEKNKGVAVGERNSPDYNKDGEFVGKANSREDHIKTYRTGKYHKVKRKLKDRSHRKSRWLYEFKNRDIWRRVTNPISCPVWNG